MILRVTNKFKTRDGRNRKFYGCSRWPECNATHGADPQGRPLGIPANKETKALRRIVHKEAERIWGEWDAIDAKQKQVMYDWMRENTTSGHIAKMLKPELLDTLEKLKALLI